MANEIVVTRALVREARPGVDYISVEGYFIDPIAPPMATDAGVTLVLTPSQRLPDDALDFGIFTQAELDAFDAGEALWSAFDLTVTEPDPSVQLIAQKLRALYANEDRVGKLRSLYRFFGQRVNA